MYKYLVKNKEEFEELIKKNQWHPYSIAEDTYPIEYPCIVAIFNECCMSYICITNSDFSKQIKTDDYNKYEIGYSFA